ncbi:MAG: hypothetical protein AB1798_11545, partial [Spirochaetota bacterium]
MNYPVRAFIFLVFLTIAAFAAGCLIVKNTPYGGISFFNLLIWCVLGTICESGAVYLVRGNIYVSTTEAIFVACYLTSGAFVTLLVIGCSMFFHFSRLDRQVRHVLNTRFRLTLFNLAHYVLILGIADLLYRISGGQIGRFSLIPSMLIAPLFFLLSCILNALFYRLEEGRAFFKYLLDTFRTYLPGASLVSLSGVVIALAFL